MPFIKTAKAKSTKSKKGKLGISPRAGNKTAPNSPKQPAAPKEPEWGWLNINSHPWSYVTVDGKTLKGHTPYRRIKLRSGSHELVFENPELGIKQKKRVEVAPWEETNVGIRLK